MSQKAPLNSNHTHIGDVDIDAQAQQQSVDVENADFHQSGCVCGGTVEAQMASMHLLTAARVAVMPIPMGAPAAISLAAAHRAATAWSVTLALGVRITVMTDMSPQNQMPRQRLR